MKSVLISIRPEWCRKITKGEKTIELRKTKPKLEAPFKCYIYETQGKLIRTMKLECDATRVFYYEGRCEVIGEFVCSKIEPVGILNNLQVDIDVVIKSCLEVEDVLEYSNGKKVYAWHISELKMYDIPKKLSEFATHDRTYDNAFGWAFEDRNKSVPLKRPPQCWCYVEELKWKNG